MTGVGARARGSRAWMVLWAQWRSWRNANKIAWLMWTASAIWWGMFAFGGVSIGLLLSRPEAVELTTALAGGLLVVSLWTQAVPLMLATSGMSIDLQKIKMYPIPSNELFAIEVLLRVSTSIETMLLVMGAAAGLLFNPALSGWRFLGVLAFLLFHLLLGVGLRDFVVRVLGRRKLRTVFTLLFVAFFLLPRFLMPRGSAGREWIRAQMASAWWDHALLPWSATARIFTGPEPWVSTLTMVGWLMIAGVFALWQFRRTLAFDPDAASSAGSGAGVEPTRSGRLAALTSLPSRMFGDGIGVLVEKEFRYMARSPRFRMLLLMSCGLGLLMASNYARNASPGPHWGRPDFLVLAAAYSLLMLGQVAVWNAFGMDRSAAQFYFVAPLRIERVMMAKNIAGALLVLFGVSITAGAARLLQFPVTAMSWAEALSVTVTTAVFLFAGGNYLSVRNPVPIDPESAMRQRAASGVQAMFVFVYPLLFLPTALAYLARWEFESHAAFYGVLAVMTTLGAIAYWVSMDSIGPYAEQHKEKMLATLSARQDPVSS
jgi:ABC-2 type transport system permease protein